MQIHWGELVSHVQKLIMQESRTIRGHPGVESSLVTYWRHVLLFCLFDSKTWTLLSRASLAKGQDFVGLLCQLLVVWTLPATLDGGHKPDCWRALQSPRQSEAFINFIVEEMASTHWCTHANTSRKCLVIYCKKKNLADLVLYIIILYIMM